MHSVTKDLEETLGPDTGELSIRVGIHSGSVTAGVLQGGSRFQLFGDSMVSDSHVHDEIHVVLPIVVSWLTRALHVSPY